MSEEKDLPQATREATFVLFGVPIRCSVLEDGRRIIRQEDFVAFLAAMENPESPYDEAEFMRFAEWRQKP